MKTFTIALITLLLFSCGKKTDKEIESGYINAFLKHVNISKETNWVVILPGLGCHGCIQEGEQFMKDNVKKKGVYFILTKIESLKILQNKIGVDLKTQSNVYADKENALNIPTNNNIYPCIVRLENGKIIDHEFQCPQNSEAFNNLKERINK